MSNPFGPPPPPAPQVFEPRPVVIEDEVPQREKYRGRRRLAVWTAFFAVALLVLANLAIWLHFDGVRASRAPSVASATFEGVTDAAAQRIDAVLIPAVSSATANSTRKAVPQKLPQDVDNAVHAALTSPAGRAAWEQAVAGGLEQEQKAMGGVAIDDSAIVLSVKSPPVITAALTQLKAQGYSSPAAPIEVADYDVTVSAASGGVATALGTLADLWWLLLLGAIALAATSITVAARRLRMATILAVDAAAMLAVCLLIVPLARQVADDQAIDQSQESLVVQAYDALTRSLFVQTLTLMLIAACSAIVLGVLARRETRRQAPAGTAEAAA